MPAYKYFTDNNYNPYLQATIKSQMGKKYLYHGRLYSQAKENEEINYVDIKFDLDLRLQSWTTSNIDIEVELKSVLVTEEHRPISSKCDTIVAAIEDIKEIMFFMRISNTGNVLRLFNVTDLMKTHPKITNEQKAIAMIELNPLFSAFLSGFIDDKMKSTKPFESHLLSGLSGRIDLKLESKKARFNNAKEIFITDRKLQLDKQAQELLDNESKHRVHSADDSIVYDYSTLITVNKGLDKILPFSVAYSTEESLTTKNNVFVSVGLEKVIVCKDVDFMTKFTSMLRQKISAIF